MGKIDPSPALSASPDGVVLQIKVVPGASRTRIAGMLGDRLKVMVAAPPEGGKANQAVCELLSETLHLSPRDVVVDAGHGQPRKKILLLGASLCAVRWRESHVTMDLVELECGNRGIWTNKWWLQAMHGMQS